MAPSPPTPSPPSRERGLLCLFWERGLLRLFWERGLLRIYFKKFIITLNKYGNF
jgi:hypothetical protein